MNRPEFITRSITGLFIVALTLAAIIFSPWSYLIWLSIIGFLGTREYLRLENISLTSVQSFLFPLILSLVSLGTGYVLMSDINPITIIPIIPVLIGMLCMVLLPLLKDPEELSKFTKASYSATAYIGLPIISGSLFLSDHYDFRLVLVPVFLIWLNDVGAYLIGSQWGKHKIAPAISPGKSREGTVGGGLITLLTGFLLTRLWSEIPSTYILVLSVAVPFFALAGDLWESALKRTAGVKDSGRLFPGHGGILDRYDSLLFVLPVAALAYYIFVL